MTNWYDRQGNPVGVDEAGRLLEDKATKVVAQEEVGPYFVSTVWLGLDHGWGDDPPLIFETMVFEKGNSLDLLCWRYATEEQAKRGHDKVMAMLRSEQKLLWHEPDWSLDDPWD